MVLILIPLLQVINKSVYSKQMYVVLWRLILLTISNIYKIVLETVK